MATIYTALEPTDSTRRIKIEGTPTPVEESTGVGLLETTTSGRGPKTGLAEAQLDIDGRRCPLWTAGSTNSIYHTRKWAVPIEGGSQIGVVAPRILAWVLTVLLALILAGLLIYLATGQNVARNTIDYIGSTTGITDPNEETTATIGSYPSFESIPDQTWTADSTTQSMTIRNLAGNEVDVAPHIYVDLNGDGNLDTATECVFNPISYDASGKVVDYGSRIAAGDEITSITLTRTVPSGTYDAAVEYTALFPGTDTTANGMTMGFILTVG